MPYLEIYDGATVTLTNELAITFPYECDNFQKYAFNAIHKNHNVLICAPTGLGKTVPCIYAIAYQLRKNSTNRIIYTTPIKTLSNQKYKELTEIFTKFGLTNNIPITVGLLTGDNKINPDANVIVATTEVLRNALYCLAKSGQEDTPNNNNNNNTDLLTNLTCVILDEIHFICDKSRGTVYEETIVLLPSTIQLIMPSATLGKADEFATWIGNIKKVTTHLIQVQKRIIPLQHYIYSNNKLHQILDNDNNFFETNYYQAKDNFNKYLGLDSKKFIHHVTSPYYGMFQDFIKYIKQNELTPTLFFTFSRKNCEKLASMVTVSLVDHIERKKIEETFDKYMLPHKERYSHLQQYQTLYKLALNGIAYHHSGLVPILKEIVEILFCEGRLKLLFATETFAIGVNASCSLVVFAEIEKFDDSGRRLLTTAEYRQMSGRSGRRGRDPHGTIVYLPMYEFPELSQLKTVMLGKLPHVTSKFDISYTFLLKIILSNATTMDTFIDSSLFSKDKALELNNAKMDYTIKSQNLTPLNIPTEALQQFQQLDQLNNTFEHNAPLQSKSQLKEHAKIMSLITKNTTLTTYYQIYQKYQTHTMAIKHIQHDIQHIESYTATTTNAYLNVLQEFNYIMPTTATSLTKSHITIKGILAANINECNAILLTEILTQDIFADLAVEEVVSLIAIFIDDGDPNNPIDKHQILGTDNIHDRLDKILKIIDQFQQVEQKYGIRTNWDIHYEYIDAAYAWATNYELRDVFKYLGNTTFEGNFIRNILKISNINRDMISLCKISNKLELLPILEQIDGRIIRDIVSVTSLYL